MQLRSGIRLAVAPRFHGPASWRDRLALNSGVECLGDAFVPRSDWRPPSAEELTLIVAETAPAGTDDMLAADVAGFIYIPSHVRRAWWDAAERSESFDGTVPGYERFVGHLVEFLRFKRLPFPEQCSFDVVASRPEQPSTRFDPVTGRLAGLAHSAGGSPPLAAPVRTLARINLGDEATHLVLCNIPLEPLPRAGDRGAASGDARAFFEGCREYPLVRLRLDPGDGLWLPASGAIHDGWTHGKKEPDIILTMSTGL